MSEKKVGEISIRDVQPSFGLSTLGLTAKGITMLRGFGIHDDLHILYLQKNKLSSFTGFGSQPALRILDVSHNRIKDFRGLERQPKLEEVLLAGNPVAKHPFYRLMLLLAVGPSLKRIDGSTVLQNERDLVKSMGPRAMEAVRLGWLLDTKPRSALEFDRLLDEFEKQRPSSGAASAPPGSTSPTAADSAARPQGDIRAQWEIWQLEADLTKCLAMSSTPDGASADGGNASGSKQRVHGIQRQIQSLKQRSRQNSSGDMLHHAHNHRNMTIATDNSRQDGDDDDGDLDSEESALLLNSLSPGTAASRASLADIPAASVVPWPLLSELRLRNGWLLTEKGVVMSESRTLRFDQIAEWFYIPDCGLFRLNLTAARQFVDYELLNRDEASFLSEAMQVFRQRYRGRSPSPVRSAPASGPVAIADDSNKAPSAPETTKSGGAVASAAIAEDDKLIADALEMDFDDDEDGVGKGEAAEGSGAPAKNPADADPAHREAAAAAVGESVDDQTQETAGGSESATAPPEHAPSAVLTSSCIIEKHP